jgi:two-component system cell cycle response regulator CpdR
MKILVAEDEPAILELYKIVLELNNHEVFLTNNGEECLDVFHEHAKQLAPSHTSRGPFDIVLLDYRMPRKNGLQVATEILSTCPRQRIVMVSAYASEIVEGLTKALKNSIKVLEKPIEFENLTKILENESRRDPVPADDKHPSPSAGLWINEKLKENMK